MEIGRNACFAVVLLEQLVGDLVDNAAAFAAAAIVAAAAFAYQHGVATVREGIVPFEAGLEIGIEVEVAVEVAFEALFAVGAAVAGVAVVGTDVAVAAEDVYCPEVSLTN